MLVTQPPRLENKSSCVTLAVFFWNIMHKIDFVKPVLDLDSQLQLLQKRGLIINNWEESLKTLINLISNYLYVLS
jgi:hypothetical protein